MFINFPNINYRLGRFILQTSKLLDVALLILFASSLNGCGANNKITGTIFINKNEIECTKIKCLDCCNDCEGSVYFITGIDTIQLIGTINGQKIEFIGKECNMQSILFEVGQKYELEGSFIRNKNRTTIKTFNVVGLKLIK